MKRGQHHLDAGQVVQYPLLRGPGGSFGGSCGMSVHARWAERYQCHLSQRVYLLLLVQEGHPGDAVTVTE